MSMPDQKYTTGRIKNASLGRRKIGPLDVMPCEVLQCPSSKYMGPLSLFHNGGFGSSWIDVKPLGADGSSGGFGWSVF